MIAAIVAVAAAEPSPVRRSAAEAPLPEEIDARQRLGASRCRVGSLYPFVPGLAQACAGHPIEGGALGTLAFGQLGAGIAILVASPPAQGDLDYLGSARGTFLLAATEPFVYSAVESSLDAQRAAGLPYVPLERTGDLFAAPFRWRNLRRPEVALGTFGLVGAGVALGAVLDGPPEISFADPDVLGLHPPAAIGYPALAVLHGGLMIQVATTEEAVFRGYVQSGLVRATSETGGWALGTLVFGALHAPNALFLPEEDRVAYLAVAVPYITFTGAFLGLSYRWSGYRLGPPVAMHFWYNTLVSAAGFLADPEHHAFSLRVGGRF